MDRRQIATLVTLRELGLKAEIRTFEQRLIVQKSVYLVQAAGLDLGYFYHWYLRGPYSPDLSRDLFPAADEVEGGERSWERCSLDAPSQRRLADLKPLFTARDGMSAAGWLELLASVHFLVVRQGLAPAPKVVARRLQLAGKNFDDRNATRALSELRGASLLG